MERAEWDATEFIRIRRGSWWWQGAVTYRFQLGRQEQPNAEVTDRWSNVETDRLRRRCGAFTERGKRFPSGTPSRSGNTRRPARKVVPCSSKIAATAPLFARLDE